MLLLLFLSLLTLYSCVSQQYYFVNKNITWTEAQTYCRQIYTDLATIKNSNNTSSLIAAVNGSYNGLSWIGLYDDVENGWKWYLDDDAFYEPGERDYRNWEKIGPQPNNILGNQMCTAMTTDGFWNDLACSQQMYFICYNKTSNSYVLISLSKNVYDARQHCRQYHTDLASIRNATENQLIFNKTEGNIVWIGLYRNRQWSDQSNSTYENWLTGQPDNVDTVEHCTAASLSNSGQWTDENCNRTLPFFCNNGPSLPTYENVIGLRARFTSWRNLTDAEIENLVLQKIQTQLISKGLSSTIKLRLIKVLKRNSITFGLK